VSEFSWLFWTLVVFLFAESWARAWVSYHRGSEPPHAPQDPASRK